MKVGRNGPVRPIHDVSRCNKGHFGRQGPDGHAHPVPRASARAGAGRLVVTVDRDQCLLLVYPLNEWEQIERKLMALPTLHAQSRRLQRLMVTPPTWSSTGHGRLLLPPELREFAGLGRHAMLVGQGGRFELWDETRWTERRDFWLKSEESSTDLPAELDSPSPWTRRDAGALGVG
ncbi:MAG: hypothetical protein U1F06_10560 [Steroidobacteraceae bacterium]